MIYWLGTTKHRYSRPIFTAAKMLNRLNLMETIQWNIWNNSGQTNVFWLNMLVNIVLIY